MVVISSCASRNNYLVDGANLKDTIYRQDTEVISNDTFIHKHKFFYVSTDTTVPLSNFYYEACVPPCKDGDSYRIYFDKDKTLAFCDSMLRSFPPVKDNEFDDYWDEKNLYTRFIKERITKGKLDVVRADEEITLLNRFHPSIINSITGHKPKYMIVHEEDNVPGDAWRGYFIKTLKGDTLCLDLEMLRLLPIQQPDGSLQY
jgi:hypothetical protein